MSLSVSGKIHKIYDLQSITATFIKREFILETEGDYPQFIKIETKQDKTSMLNNLSVGDVVNVHINLEGREWQDKFFTNISAWKIDVQKQSKSNSSTGSSQCGSSRKNSFSR